MTNNEQIKQAINKNMASIYSALEQVGATLPEKKNLENISLSLTGLQESISFNESLAILQGISFVDITLYGGSTHSMSEYQTALDKAKYWMQLHLYGEVTNE